MSGPDVETPEHHFPDIQNTMYHPEILNFELDAATGWDFGLV